MSTTEKPIFDNHFFNNITEGDREFTDELIELFISSSGDQLLEIKKVADSKDSDSNAWHSALHSLKGSCSSIGALKLAEFIIDNQNKGSELTQEDRIKIHKEIAIMLDKTTSKMLELRS